MTTEDHATRVAQILSEARKEALVATTWTCSAGSKDRIRYVAIPSSWWNRFSVGWVAGLLFCLALDVLFS